VVREWRVPVGLTAGKGIAAVGLGVVAFFGADDRGLLFLAGVAAVGALVLVLRDVVAPVRLRADDGGVTVVSGFAGKVFAGWAEVAEVRVDETSRYGLRVLLLEIETVGQDVYLLSRHDLGADPRDVREELAGLRR
jgi:PH (Pleckstrin Homology) domain-containing protein